MYGHCAQYQVVGFACLYSHFALCYLSGLVPFARLIENYPNSFLFPFHCLHHDPGFMLPLAQV